MSDQLGFVVGAALTVGGAIVGWIGLLSRDPEARAPVFRLPVGGGFVYGGS